MYKDRPLIGYLPDVLREVREYEALAAAEEPEISILWDNIYIALNDQFVQSASEYGIERLEGILDITPKATFSLDDRRFTILSRMNEKLPYTMRMLKEKLAVLCGSNGFELLLEGFVLDVKVALSAINNFSNVRDLLSRVCPANILISLSVKYNQHFTLARFRHGDLRDKTHNKMRNEVIDSETH
jgi:hypothetical protein